MNTLGRISFLKLNQKLVFPHGYQVYSIWFVNSKKVLGEFGWTPKTLDERKSLL